MTIRSSWCSALALLSLQIPVVASTGVQNPPKKPAPPVRIDYDAVKRLFGDYPAAPPVDNPSTPEKVKLGKVLYHEKSLSKQGNLSCASCHDIATYGVDNKPVSPGSDGKDGDRNTPTTLNAFRQFAQFWDYRATTVEEQAMGPILNSVEHGIADEAELVTKLKAKTELVDGFKAAFPKDADPVTVANFKLAIGAFERTLVTKSKFDAYLDGDQKALGNDEKLGLKTFMEVGCITCHTSRLLGGHMPQKSGVMKPYPSEDPGRAKVSKNDAEKGFFKVPQLLNVEKTAPYYHDGKVATLEDAVSKMADLQLNRQLKPEEVAQIVAFLKTLTGQLPKLE